MTQTMEQTDSARRVVALHEKVRLLDLGKPDPQAAPGKHRDEYLMPLAELHDEAAALAAEILPEWSKLAELEQRHALAPGSVARFDELKSATGTLSFLRSDIARASSQLFWAVPSGFRERREEVQKLHAIATALPPWKHLAALRADLCERASVALARCDSASQRSTWAELENFSLEVSR